MRKPFFSLLVALILVATWTTQARAESSDVSAAVGGPSGVITKAYTSMDAWLVQFAGTQPETNDIFLVSRNGQPVCQVIYAQFPNYGHVVTRVDPEPNLVPKVGDTVTYVKPGPSVNPHRFAMLRSFQQAGVVANQQGQVYNEYYNGAVYGIRGGPSSYSGYGVDRSSGPLRWTLPGPGPTLLNDGY